MDKKIKSISCAPECGFMVRSHEGNEVMDIAMRHVKKAHPKMKVTPDDLKSRMKSH